MNGHAFCDPCSNSSIRTYTRVRRNSTINTAAAATIKLHGNRQTGSRQHKQRAMLPMLFVSACACDEPTFHPKWRRRRRRRRRLKRDHSGPLAPRPNRCRMLQLSRWAWPTPHGACRRETPDLLTTTRWLGRQGAAWKRLGCDRDRMIRTGPSERVEGAPCGRVLLTQVHRAAGLGGWMISPCRTATGCLSSRATYWSSCS